MRMHYKPRFTETNWFAYLLVAIASVVVVYGVYWWNVNVAMPEHDACAAKGGMVIQDMYGMPTCATGGVVILPEQRIIHRNRRGF